MNAKKVEAKILNTIYRALKKRLRPRSNDKGWHREAVGGEWEKIGKLQFDFMVTNGLRPEHYFLDIGCGCLRGGVRFIGFLNVGHYYGIEKEESLLHAGRDIELKRCRLEQRCPRLFLIDSFDLSCVPRDIQFDFMLAQSVFTHLTPDMIELCLNKVTPRLRPNGTMYATFFESIDEKIDVGRPHPRRRDERGKVQYPFTFFQEFGQKFNLSVSYIGNWNHPRNQKMLAFRRR